MIFAFILILVLVGITFTLLSKQEKSTVESSRAKKQVPVKKLSLDEKLQLEKAANVSQLVNTVGQVKQETLQRLLTVLNNLEKSKR